jgi:hypothetical protein
MFFLVDETRPFPLTFPVGFQSGVSMNEAVRQPIELIYPHKYRFSLPFFFQQISTPVFLPDGSPVSNPTSTTVSATGTGRTATEPV